LKHGGYEVSALYGGFNTWKQMGYPVSTGGAQ
jgi:3-mercaptopyruvate sulfurtransferase SseA